MQSRSKSSQTSGVISKNKPKVIKASRPGSGDNDNNVKNSSGVQIEKLKSVTGKHNNFNCSTSPTNNKKLPEKLPPAQVKSNYSSPLTTSNSQNLTLIQQREKLRPVSVKSIYNNPTSLSSSNKLASSQNISSKNNIDNKSKETKSSKLSITSKTCLQDKSGILKNSELSLSKEYLDVLSEKFKNISSSIIKLASSQKLVSVGSLECLLDKEISRNLGDDVNNPEHAQGFIHSTRGLIEDLVITREEGSSKIQLHSNNKKEKKYFIKADTNNSVCYRDQYLKELVINVIQSMTSDEVEKNVTPVRSEESKERLRRIRDMVRAEAGVEPEDFKKLERKLEQLQQSLTQNKTEVDKTSKEVEEFIFQHKSDEEIYTDCLEIPNPARKVLQSYYNKTLESKQVSHSKTKIQSLCNNSGNGNTLSSLSKNPNCKNIKDSSVKDLNTPSKNWINKDVISKKIKSKCEKDCSISDVCEAKNKTQLSVMNAMNEKDTPQGTNCSSVNRGPGYPSISLSENELWKGGREKYEKSLSILGEENHFEKGSSDATENIRPYTKQLIHDELLRVMMINENVLRNNNNNNNNNNEFVHNQEVTPKSSFESLDYKSAASNLSVNEDSEIEISRKNTPLFVTNQNEDIDEKQTVNENAFAYEESVTEFNLDTSQKESSQSVDGKYRISLETVADNCKTLITNNGIINDDSYEGTSFCRIKRNKVTEIHKNSPSETKVDLKNFNIIKNVQSKWWTKNESDVGDIFTDMRNALEIMKDMSYDFSSNNKFNENLSEKTYYSCQNIEKECSDDLEFTVDEIVNVLINISIKINELPKYLHNAISNITPSQKEQAQPILSLLGEYIDGSHGNSMLLKNDDIDSFPIESIANTFFILSEALNNFPVNIKSQKISDLNPPKSLITTLNKLSNISYFKDCFTRKIGEGLYSNDNETTAEGNIEQKYYFSKEKLSDEKLTFEIHKNPVKSIPKECETEASQNERRINDLEDNLVHFEHFMGLTSSVMTVQNVSDMFLFLSAVLNDIPERLKSERIVDLNPPSSLLIALDILYGDEDLDLMSGVPRTKSFASLTLQNVSDFLLTLSKTFDGIPERLKESVIINLDPPRSLLRAITLLTSLSHFSIQESYSQEIEEELYEKTGHIDKQDRFFDAVGSIPSVRKPCLYW